MISPERFDGTAIWATLSQEGRDAIGAAALEVVAARFSVENVYDRSIYQTPAQRAADAAENAADEHLDDLFVQFVERRLLVDVEKRTKLPSAVGMVCMRCGCTDSDACAGGCGWAGPDICTACNENAGSGVSPPEPAS